MGPKKDEKGQDKKKRSSAAAAASPDDDEQQEDTQEQPAKKVKGRSKKRSSSATGETPPPPALLRHQSTWTQSPNLVVMMLGGAAGPWYPRLVHGRLAQDQGCRKEHIQNCTHFRGGDEIHGTTGQKVKERPIASTFYAPFDLYERGKFDEILEGMVSSHAQNEDMAISEAMTSKMFEDAKTGVGLDLAAQILQQGRDHGIAGYNRWRHLCGLPKAASFQGLSDVVAPENIKKLQGIYKHVDDVDLFTGGLAEKPNCGALVGPTFGCLIGRQFHHLRRGDRYWYEDDIPPSSFTKEQLYELCKTSLGRVICDSSDKLQHVQPKVMLEADSFLNAPMACQGKHIKGVDLKKWKTASPNFIIPDKMLQESIERARRDITNMRDSEWNLWEARQPLPSPRLISTNMHNDVSAPHVRYTLMVMQWGQLIDHDIIFTPINKGYREQMNQVTGFVDASHTHGSDKCEQRQLRMLTDGKLRGTPNPLRGKLLLPTEQENHECQAPSGRCFIGGDTRASEQPGLTALHTLMMREHNCVAGELKRLNKHWSDEQLFQNARRIVTAINQHVTYNEWLPRVLGWNAVNLYGLNLLPEGHYEGYDAY
ncbi:thyroid peroxidase-like [Eriocheir sinensis]|uniref:thyroid peroxidase-like n=1 Tax=Eriocheir sinensis TaxID=95602 RepID=UPI0021CA6985|nr:thyroid peroxidase-like [Eriocheir sinensis]